MQAATDNTLQPDAKRRVIADILQHSKPELLGPVSHANYMALYREYIFRTATPTRLLRSD